MLQSKICVLNNVTPEIKNKGNEHDQGGYFVVGEKVKFLTKERQKINCIQLKQMIVYSH